MFFRFFIVISLLFLSGLDCLADSLIVNADFQQCNSNGIPDGWKLSPANSGHCRVSNNALTLYGEAQFQTVSLVQENLPLKSGHLYLLSYDFAGKNSPECCVYITCTSEVAEKNLSRSFNKTWVKASSAAKQFNMVFKVPANTKGSVINLSTKGSSPVQFSKLSLICISDLPLFNSDFHLLNAAGMPYGWAVKGNPKSFRFDNGTLKISPALSGGNASLIHNSALRLSKVKYKITGEVKGENCKYRVYYEWIRTDENRKPTGSGSSGAGFADVPGQWTKFEKNITMPDVFTISYLVVNVKGDGNAEFRNLAVTADYTGTLQARLYQSKSGLTGIKVNKANQEFVTDKINVGAGKRYLLQYKVCGEGSSGTATGFHNFELTLKFDNGKTISLPSDDVWNNSPQNKNFSFQVPQGASSFEVSASTDSSGSVILGDFKCTEAAALPEDSYRMVISAPAYRNTIFTSVPTPEIKGRIVAPKATKLSVYLNGNESLQKNAVVKRINADTYSFSIDATDLPTGEYVLAASINDEKSVKKIEKKIFKAARSASEITIDGKGNCYINGKIFFPIVLMTLDVRASDLAFYTAARSGFNVIRIGGDRNDILTQLDIAEKYGLKLIPCIGALGKTEADFKAWKKRARSILTHDVITHPALFGYFLTDEPAWVGTPLENVVEAYDLVKGLDIYHPVWINAAPRGTKNTHKLFSQGADIYGIDIYPVPYPSSHSNLDDRSMTSVGKYSDMLREEACPGKAIWMILQGFSWDALRKTSPLTYPAWHETRFMVYDALTKGSNAIGYWGTPYIENVDFYKTLFRMAKELDAVSGIFTRAILDKSVVVKGHKSIDGYSYNYNGRKYLIAINRSDKTAVATAYGFNAASVIRYSDKQKVKLANGKLEIALQPWGVAIYADGALPETAGITVKYDAKLEKMPDPYCAAAVARHNSRPYPGKASWIWEKTTANKPGSQAALARIVELSVKPEHGELRIATDDSAEIYVNGKSVGKQDDWKHMERFDITDFLKAGTNVIVLIAKDKDCLPCGVLAEILINSGGKEYIINSDKKWLASADYDMKKLHDAAILKKWENAWIVAEYGYGAWRKEVILGNELKKAGNNDNAK